MPHSDLSRAGQVNLFLSSQNELASCEIRKLWGGGFPRPPEYVCMCVGLCMCIAGLCTCLYIFVGTHACVAVCACVL